MDIKTKVATPWWVLLMCGLMIGYLFGSREVSKFVFTDARPIELKMNGVGTPVQFVVKGEK